MEQNQTETTGIQRIAKDVWGWTAIAMRELTESATGNFIGQSILQGADNVLWMMEKSAQWALPLTSTDNAEKNMVPAELIRPLPWLLFLPMLLFLRLLREGISFGALLLGKEPIRPSTIVRFIQNSRRSLRILKYQGLRNIRAKNNGHAAKPPNFIPKGVVESVSKIIERMFCFNAVKYSNHREGNTLVRKNSGEMLTVVKKKLHATKRQLSRDESGSESQDDNILKRLIVDNGDEVETESDDSDFSLQKVSDKENDTSEASTESESENEDSDATENHNEQPPITESTNNNEHQTDEDVQGDQPRAENEDKQNENELKMNGTINSPDKSTAKITENFLYSEAINRSPDKSPKNKSSGSPSPKHNGKKLNNSVNNGERHDSEITAET